MNKWKLVIFILSIFISNMSFAVGLGKIRVYSYLNETLSAEIELKGVENLNTDLLIATLASPKDFVRANMTRPFFLTKLQFEIVRHEEQTVIYVTSTKPVKHPFLDFLVELSWPDGKLVKGYTILIDPTPKGKNASVSAKTLFAKKNLINNDSQGEESKPFASTIKTQSSKPQPSATKNVPEQVIQHPLPTNRVIPAAPTTTKSTIDGSQSAIAEHIVPSSEIKKHQSKDLKHIPKVQTLNLENEPNNESDLSVEDEELQNALVDNIQVNKQAHPTGLLQGIVSAVKENPIFSQPTIDGKSLAEQKVVEEMPATTINAPVTLEDVVNKEHHQTTTSLPSPTKSNTLKQKQINTTENKKVQVKDLHDSSNKVGNQQNSSLMNKHNSLTEKSLYKKYGLQLVLSFLMVLISGIFAIKLLKRSHFTYLCNDVPSHELGIIDKSNWITTKPDIKQPEQTRNDIPTNHNLKKNALPADELSAIDITQFESKTETEHKDDLDISLAEFISHEETDVKDLDLAELDLESLEIDSIDNNEQIKTSTSPNTPKFAQNNDYLDDELSDSYDLLNDHKIEIDLKIDLAKQYIEAGDTVSAKNILSEIVDFVEGEQKHEIDILLNGLITTKT